jgi:hypothetical protein
MVGWTVSSSHVVVICLYPRGHRKLIQNVKLVNGKKKGSITSMAI